MRSATLFPITAILLVLLGAGCTPASVATTTPKTGHEAAGLASRFFHETWKDTEDTERCLFELMYPQLEPSYAQSEEDYERWDAANRLIQDIAFAGIVATTTENEYDVQSSAIRYIAECKSDIEAQSESDAGEPWDGLRYIQSVGYTAQLFQNGLLSLVIQGYSYTGGAHGLPWMTGLTLTLPEADRLTLGDLIKPEALKPLMQRVRRELLREWKDALFEEAVAEFEAFVNDSSSITDEERDRFSSYEQFYLTPDGLVFYWNVYEITPYAAGQQTVFVPYGEIRDLLAPGSPLAPFLP